MFGIVICLLLFMCTLTIWSYMLCVLTRGSGMVSSAADVLWVSVVRGM